MPRVASTANPAWVKARKVLMLQAQIGSTETILPPVSKRPAYYGQRTRSVGRSLDPMSGKLM